MKKYGWKLKIIPLVVGSLLTIIHGAKAYSVDSDRFQDAIFASDIKVSSNRMDVVKALAPESWTVSNSNLVDPNVYSSFEAHSGEQWVFALDRWLLRERLTADVDWALKSIRLQPSPDNVAPNYIAATAPLRYIGETQSVEVVEQDLLMRADMETVISSIIPKNWRFKASEGVDKSAMSSANVKAGEPWTKPFQIWLDANGLVAQVDWSRKEVALTPKTVLVAQRTNTDMTLGVANSIQPKAMLDSLAPTAFEALSDQQQVLIASADEKVAGQIVQKRYAQATVQGQETSDDGLALKASNDLEDTIVFASGSVRLGPVARAKAKYLWEQMDSAKQQMFMYGYSGKLRDTNKMSEIALARAISAKIYMVNEFAANPDDITVVDPIYYLHQEALPAKPKQVKVVIKDKDN